MLESDQIKLIKRVFTSDDGKKLLDALSATFVEVELFNRDPIEMSKNVGKHDLVQDLMNNVKMSDHELTALVKEEQRIPLIDD